MDWKTVPPTRGVGKQGEALWRTLTIGIVEYSTGYVADHWCSRGHVLFVLEGELVTKKKSAEKASELGAEFFQRGFGIEIRDLFNASICLSRSLPLLTRNIKHFQRVSDLKLSDIA